MLHENALMVDIDVDHWRNLQNLLLDSAKEKRRIIIIHEEGEIIKFVHSGKAKITRPITRVTQPQADAKAVYEANRATTDFVLIVERRASDEYFRKIQDTWTVNDDIDEYVHRAFVTMDDYPDGIAAFPGPASSRLGLQWRLGASYEGIEQAIKAFIPADSCVVFGIFEGDRLWSSLVLGFGAERRITLVTTVDPSELTVKTGRQAIAHDVVSWTGRKFSPVALGLFADIADARQFLSRTDKPEVIRNLFRTGKLLADPVPESLSRLIL